MPPDSSARAAALYREGRTDREIAAELGVPAGTVAGWLHRLRDAGDDLPSCRPAPWTANDDQRLVAGADEGQEIEALAAALGRSPSAVTRRLERRHGRTQGLRLWTDAEDAALARAYAAGARSAAIAETLGRRSPAAVSDRIEQLQQAGQLEQRRPRWSEKERRRLVKRY